MAIVCNTQIIWDKFTYKKNDNIYTILTDKDLAFVLKEKYGYMEVNRDFVKYFRKKNNIKSCKEGLQNCTDLRRLHFMCVKELIEMFGKPEPTGALEMQTVDVKDWEKAGGNWEEAKKRAQKRRTKVKNVIKKHDGQGLAEFGLIVAIICSLIIHFLK